ncbi:MAG: pentapeptide repeat-containing protein [Cyanobacteria bacterium P01_A01_bin.80]
MDCQDKLQIQKQQIDEQHYYMLMYATFADTNLNQARLNGVNLQFCELNDADIMACDFKGTINLTPKQIKVSKNWELGICKI